MVHQELGRDASRRACVACRSATVATQSVIVSTSKYRWRRFWCRREGSLGLDLDGYLSDPECYGWNQSQGVVDFSQVASDRCAVLLGEPGMSCVRQDGVAEAIRVIVI
jgi:hypothetical protein